MYWITGIMGIFMMAAPYLLNYANNLNALWTSLIAGFVVLGVSVWEGTQQDKADWEYWVAALVGIFAIIAPFILGFGNHATAMWTTVSAGAIVAVVAGSRLWTGGASRI